MNDPNKVAGEPRIVRARPEQTPEVVAVLCESFHDYPVMRYLLGDLGARYDDYLSRLVGVFVASRVLHGNPIFAVEEAGRLTAVATITPPGDHVVAPEVQETREALWQELDPGAKTRADLLTAVWLRTALPAPQYHVNMLGVLRSRAGRGLGGRLLREVHELSRLDPGSTGVSLTTEDPKNVPLYQHCGYEIVAHDRVSPELETWGFFRRDETQ
jgi:GNAT superfamily N-acetyltransferase